VGILTALVFLLTLEDKNRFTSSRTVGAFVGLRPRKSQSGDDDPQLRINQGGRPISEKTSRAMRELHDGSVWQRQRPTTLGTGAHQTGRQECAETSTRSFGTKDGGAHAPTLSDGRGLRAVGLRGEEINGGLTNATAQIRESEVLCESSATERETTNRPARGTARSCSGTQARYVDGSPLAVRTPMCTGPRTRPNQSADGSMAERVPEQSWVNGSATIDTERPPHGKHDRGLA
jgi:transposase IS116/IS110/IS902 family protein